MEIKKQILLPKSSFALANDEDVFINLQLNKTFSDLKTEKINNVFNMNEQYNTERQNSLKFCIFGLIESRFEHSGNLIIEATDSDGLTLHLPKISIDNITGKTLSIRTFELTLGSNGMSRNLYGKTKSAYSIMFEINKKELEEQNQKIIDEGGIPKTKYIQFTLIDTEKSIYFLTTVPYIFYDLEGNFVSYGSQTADVDEEGNVLELNNDFDFLYDRHWIRKYFDFPAPSNVYFPDRVINASELRNGEVQLYSGLSAATIDINIALDQKSPYGLEQVIVDVDTDNTTFNPNQDFLFSPQIIKWNVGEQYKTFNFKILDDKFVEDTESVVFKMSNLKNCLLKSEIESKTEVRITNDDIPSKIRFTFNDITVKSDVSAVTLSYEFDKPLEVPGQSIELSYLNTEAVNSQGSISAIAGQDFILDINNPTANTLTIYFNEGDISGSTTIGIIDNNVYDLNKYFQLFFLNPSQNIIISNVGAIPNVGQVFTTTIQDSLNPLYSSFIFLNRPDRGIGAVRANRTPDANNRYYWNNDSNLGFSPASLYKITALNDGDSIVYDNKLITKTNKVKTLVVSGVEISDLVIELPSNFDFDLVTRKYKKSKYSFLIESQDTYTTYPVDNYNYSYSQNFNFSPILVEALKNAGPSGSSKYYFTTKLKGFYLNYDKTLSACTIDGTMNVIESAYTHNIVFKGYHPLNNSNNNNIFDPYFTTSTVEFSFEDSIIPIFCSQFIPFGIGKNPNPPYPVTNYLSIKFRNIYPQSNPPWNSNVPSYSYNFLRFDTPQITNTGDNTKGFSKWNSSSIDTRHALALSILNNSDSNVQISGQTIQPGDKYYIRGFDQELNDFILTLPANEAFVPSKSGFTVANYILTIENVKYFSPNGQMSGNPISFRFDNTSYLPTGALSGIPRYNIVSEFSKIYVPAEAGQAYNTGFTVNCGSSVFTVMTCGLANVAIKGMLLPNSATGFKRGYFVNETSSIFSFNNDIELTCPVGNAIRIPFKKL